MSSVASRGPAERMWPLDLGLIGLGGLVFYNVASRFRFDDPRPLYNAWTYVVVVPIVVIALSLLTRGITSKFFEKSIQLGFLFSIFVHLLLLQMAVNYVVFTRYFPTAFTGSEPRRIPVHKTVPDYVFAAPSREMTRPDWSQPTDAETASKVIPIEQRSIPPVENTAERLTMPNEGLEQPIEVEKFLIPRQIPESALPTPANAPGIRAKSMAKLDSTQSPISGSQNIQTPIEQAQTATNVSTAERSVSDPTRTMNVASPSTDAPALLLIPELRPLSNPLVGSARAAIEDRLPTIGNLGAAQQRVSPQRRERSVTAAGAAPASESVSVDNIGANAERTLSAADLPTARASDSVGATLNDQSNAMVGPFVGSAVRPGATDRSSAITTSPGMPSVEAGAGFEATSRRRNEKPGLPLPAGDSSAVASRLAADLAALGTASSVASASQTEIAGSPTERPADMSGAIRGQANVANPLRNSTLTPSSSPLQVDLPIGATGFGNIPTASPGIAVTTQAEPKIETMSLQASDRKRLDVGGPVTPVGTEIAAVESFKRRVMRTQGGATPSPVGVVGPATEEAIERGLDFLASRQQAKGHWSLQGHGEDVILQSDTAATGLCLLSFQGAGYTHQQHQYSQVVKRGLAALLEMQHPDGNLYRSENRTSDQNVAFYSHGIAALALCEAYGMTRDENLRDAAQLAINYIAETQNRERGGWRYQPQVSSDTSVSGWMMMAIKSGELAGLDVPKKTYEGIDRWLEAAKASRDRSDRYRYNPFAPDTPAQRHGRDVTPTMTAVGMLMRMYSGWHRDHPDMKSAADYLATYLPANGDAKAPLRDTYYWYYATQVMFHMGGEHWEKWNRQLNPILVDGQIKAGPQAGSWDPKTPVPDRWSGHAGRLYLTTLNLLSLEVYYRHLPIYDNTAK